MRKALILSALFLMISQNALAQSFSDIGKFHANYHAITYLNLHSIINGYQDGTFKPDKSITRAELLKIVMEGTNKALETPKTNCFSDVPYKEWYAKYICSAKSLGLIQGYGDASFKPDLNISKAEAMKIIALSYNWNLNDLSYTAPFLDATANEWFSNYVQFPKEKNFLSESSFEYFHPEENINRAQVAETIFRYLLSTELGEEVYSTSMLDQLDFSATDQSSSIQDPLENTEINQSTVLAPGIITIKLIWDEEEIDLDTHLLQPDEEEIFFMHKIDSDISAILENKAQIETLTINDLGNGTYEYFVTSYLNQENFGNATVEVYDSKGLAKMYKAPSETGIIWKVFELQPESKLTDFNIISGCAILKHSSSTCPEI